MKTQKSNWSDKISRVVGMIILACFSKYVIGIGFLLIVVAVAIGLVLLLCIPLLLNYLGKQAEKEQEKFQKEYEDFLSRVNGSRFFFYNSRRSSVEFAKDTVLPQLQPTTNVVFVDGEHIDCGPDSKFVSHMLYGVKERKGFPYLIKIVNEEPVDYSVNHLFYNTMAGKKPLTPLLQRINAFYESPAISE
ncbi:MAG: hypothetical protein M3Y54_20595 [Bacteroidota bacterium]|nr:hypothetical protein [Bacteroidota bacterium]